MSFWIGGSTGQWVNLSNWSGAIPYLPGDTAVFNFFGQTALQTVTIDPTDIIKITTLTVNNATQGMTIAGTATSYSNPATLIFISTTNGSTIGAPPVLNHNSSGTLTLASSGFLVVALNHNTTFNAAGTGSIVVSAPVTGGGMLTKTGQGELRLLGNNSFTGGLRIEQGRVLAQQDASLGGVGAQGVSLLNGAELYLMSSMSVDNAIGTVAGQSGVAGSGAVLAANGATVTLTGLLNHLGSGTLTFGAAGSTGTFVASMSTIGHNATLSSFGLAGGTVRLDSFQAAQELFFFNGTGTTAIETGATLDTAGRATNIANLDLNGGTITSSGGALQLTITDRTGVARSQSGTVAGNVAAADYLTINVVGNGATGNYDLSSTTFTNWTAGADIVTIIGSSLANMLVGSSVGDAIHGKGGTDIIQAGSGNDEVVLNSTNGGSWVDGGAGTDRLKIEGGAFSLQQFSGFEAIDLQANANLTLSAAQFATGLTANAVLSGLGNITVNLDTVRTEMLAKGMTVAAGSAGVTFTVNGSSANDVVKVATDAPSEISGNGGNDRLNGSMQGDYISGGDSVDKIRGDGGNDLLIGGTGADVFKYRAISDSTVASPDTILDFLSGTDRINFGRIDTNAVTPGDQAFAYAGTGAFLGGGTASIRWVDLGADLRVEADVDGNGTADMYVLLQGAGTQVLTAADFVL